MSSRTIESKRTNPALERLDARIKELEALQQQNKQYSAGAAERIRVAYVDALAAVQAFDRTLQRDIALCEGLAKGGYLVRLYRQLVRSAGLQAGTDM